MIESRQEELRTLWADLELSPKGNRQYRARRVRSGAQVPVYAALREGDGARTLVFEGPLSLAPKARIRFPGEGISMSDDRVASEGVVRLAASLEGGAFSGPFEALCADLIDVSEEGTSAPDTLAAIARRMTTWMASLRRRGGLTDEAVRGLFGELLCLETVAEVAGWEGAVTAWTGPDDGIHDITAADRAWEVKATAGAGSSIWINGLDQLDGSGLSGLVLSHVMLSLDQTGQSLNELSRRIRLAISEREPSALAEFERKLVAAGLTGSEPGAEVPYRVGATSFYRVAEGFPRILRADVSLGVVEARYQIRVAAIQPFSTDLKQALLMLVSGRGP